MEVTKMDWAIMALVFGLMGLMASTRIEYKE
jgi:hypothetical protein